MCYPWKTAKNTTQIALKNEKCLWSRDANTCSGRIGLRNSVGFTRLYFSLLSHSAGGRRLHFSNHMSGHDVTISSSTILQAQGHRHNVNTCFRRISKKSFVSYWSKLLFSSSHLWMCELDRKEGWKH